MPLILPKEGFFEFEEKKSRFKGHCIAVESEAEAKAYIASIGSGEKGSNHNVYAYSIKSSNIIRFNDNGEPSGTAGMPVLNVFDKKGIIDWVCVVTRYFGGIHLGAGGLVRAYTKAATGAMNDSGPIEKIVYLKYNVICEYTNFDKAKYNFDKWGVEILDISYTDIVTLNVQIKDYQAEPFLQGEYYKFTLINV